MTGSDAVVGAMEEGVAEYYLGSKVCICCIGKHFVRKISTTKLNWPREPRFHINTLTNYNP